MTSASRRFSASALDKLGKRLRRVPPDPADLDALRAAQHEWAAALDSVLAGVTEVVAGMEREDGDAPLHVTSRAKTRETLTDKLRRGTSLSRMQDVVGIRIVDPTGGLLEQDEIVRRLAARFVAADVDDRRARPSFGYRAVHVIPRIDGRAVEIQVRTGWQHAWANTMEQCGDRWGRGIRYGEPPIGSPQEVRARSIELAELVHASDLIARYEMQEREYVALIGRRAVELGRGRPGLTRAEVERLLEEYRPRDIAPLRLAIDELTTLLRTGGPLVAEFRLELEKWPLRKDW